MIDMILVLSAYLGIAFKNLVKLFFYLAVSMFLPFLFIVMMSLTK